MNYQFQSWSINFNCFGSIFVNVLWNTTSISKNKTWFNKKTFGTYIFITKHPPYYIYTGYSLLIFIILRISFAQRVLCQFHKIKKTKLKITTYFMYLPIKIIWFVKVVWLHLKPIISYIIIILCTFFYKFNTHVFIYYWYY